MLLDQIIFYFLTVSLIFFAMLIVSSKNKIRGLLFLVPFICSLSGLLMIMGFEFAALSLVFVDLSSVAVIIVFAIMIGNKQIYYKNIKRLFSFFMFSLLLAFLINFIIVFLDLGNGQPLIDNPNIFDFKNIGANLLYDRSFLFLLSGVLLFCGASGAVMLVFGIDNIEAKRTKNIINKKDREIELVKILPEKETSKI